MIIYCRVSHHYYIPFNKANMNHTFTNLSRIPFLLGIPLTQKASPKASRSSTGKVSYNYSDLNLAPGAQIYLVLFFLLVVNDVCVYSDAFVVNRAGPENLGTQSKRLELRPSNRGNNYLYKFCQ